MLMIRFQRIGRTNDPAFRIAVLEKERSAKSGRVTDLLGTYNPRSKALTLNTEKVKSWIAKGAKPTGSIHNLFVSKGILDGKKVNVVSKKALKSKAVKSSASQEAASATPVTA
jgi:small subunit ribosomal protein S16